MSALEGKSHARFPQTRWSLVRSASAGSQRALEELCEAYAPPVYAFFRGEGFGPQDAADLTQEFFANKILDAERRAEVLRDPEALAVRFRRFLRACLKNFGLHARERLSAKKRGGHLQLVSFDAAAVEARVALLSEAERSNAFDQLWAKSVVDRVFRRLYTELKPAARVVLQRTVQAAPDGEIAIELGISSNAVAKSRQRTLRQARQLLRQELQDTVSTEDDLDGELDELAKVYALPPWLRVAE